MRGGMSLNEILVRLQSPVMAKASFLLLPAIKEVECRMWHDQIESFELNFDVVEI